MKLEEKLACLRKEKGLTQIELAEAVLVSRQAVSKWETGRAVPTTDNLKILSEIYGVSVDYLLNESKEESAQEEPVQEEPVQEEPTQEEAVSEKEAEETAEKFSGNAQRSAIKWKYIVAALLLAALLLGLCIGVFIGKYSERHISIGDIPGEEVEDTPDGEFSVGW